MPPPTPAEEMVDVVDHADVVLRQVPRSVMRRDNLRHRCVWIVVVNGNGGIFIHQRTATKDVYPSFWDVAAGGVVAAGESYDAAAQRELAEELGIAGTTPAPVATIDYEDARSKVIGRVYVCRFAGVPVLQASEVAVGTWVGFDRLCDLVQTETFCPDGLLALAAAAKQVDLGASDAARGRLAAVSQRVRACASSPTNH